MGPTHDDQAGDEGGMAVGHSPGQGAAPVMPHQDAALMAQGIGHPPHILHKRFKPVVLPPLRRHTLLRITGPILQRSRGSNHLPII